MYKCVVAAVVVVVCMAVANYAKSQREGERESKMKLES
jgi:hypothetical protein